MDDAELKKDNSIFRMNYRIMNNTNCIIDWELYHIVNKPSSKQRYSYQMETYKPRNESDDLNPNYYLALLPSDLLVAIIKKQIDPVVLARKELRNHGLNMEGSWIGFKNS